MEHVTNALLLSNSTMPGTDFFSWPRPFVQSFLGRLDGPIAFIPYAAVTLTFDQYETKVKGVFRDMGYEVKGVHHAKDQVEYVKRAAAILVGGGNSFALLHRVYEHKLLEVIREQVGKGVPYIGWSAGANLGCPTIMTTNDMPVVQPPSFNALNLIPYQINPHYHEFRVEGQGGETRRERLEEFVEMNPGRKVIGLPEGMFIQRIGKVITLGGTGVAKLYLKGSPIQDLVPGAMLE